MKLFKKPLIFTLKSCSYKKVAVQMFRDFSFFVFSRAFNFTKLI